MLKPVKITVDWKNAINACDALDPANYQQLSGDWPGVYLHLIYGRASQVVGSYIGKHRISVAARQFEHLNSYVAGEYKLLDVNGGVVFPGNKIIPNSYMDLLTDHLNRMKVFFGELTYPSAPYVGVWADSSEAILQRSPSWNAKGGTHLNFSKEAPIYQMFDRFELIHTGASDALSVFGTTTIWDRVAKTVN